METLQAEHKLSDVRLIVIGSSAGGVDALKKILPAIPRKSPCAVVVVQHIGLHFYSTLAQIYKDLCQSPVKEAEDKEPIEAGCIYFAPAGYHLSVESDRSFSLSIEPPVNFVRPAVDVLLESAAYVYGKQLLGVILTGANQDGAAGLRVAENCGAFTVVQKLEEAEYATMPRAAAQEVKSPWLMSLNEIADLFAGFK